jgi:DNA end-binding protein Ku
MARARSKTKKHTNQRTRQSAGPSRRAIWTGTIDFGLVTIPVKLLPAETSNNIDFDLLDKRDFARVRYKRVNEKTGDEVPWDEIVKGYEYEKGEYVALGDEDFRQANVEATQSISITEFVDDHAISPVYFDRPYYLEPQKNGRRAYGLLREVLRRSGKVGIAKVVIRSRQHLAALLVQGPLLVLNLLRFAHELRDASGLDVPSEKDKTAVSSQEITMAERLVDAMVGEWKPQKYHDEYREDLLKLIEKKVKSGQTKAPAPSKRGPRAPGQGKVVDIMHLLRESVEKAARSAEEPRRRKAS